MLLILVHKKKLMMSVKFKLIILVVRSLFDNLKGVINMSNLLIFPINQIYLSKYYTGDIP
jgi:hypothetical protein